MTNPSKSRLRVSLAVCVLAAAMAGGFLWLFGSRSRARHLDDEFADTFGLGSNFGDGPCPII